MPGPPFLRGERLTLRSVESEDHAFVHRHWNAPEIRRGINEQRPYSREDVAEALSTDGRVNFLACDGDEPVGFVWLFRVDEISARGEIGYWVTPDEWGSGYATEAARLAIRYATEERGLRKLLARVFEDNDASMRVLEKLGFEAEGVLRDHYLIDGRYVDAHLYGRLSE